MPYLLALAPGEFHLASAEHVVLRPAPSYLQAHVHIGSLSHALHERCKAPRLLYRPARSPPRRVLTGGLVLTSEVSKRSHST
mmetsp:Transcript_22308/g.61197  ORF Transcript_22308/g.61197 Transcript_22308/m.61197 type:complete len:82 (+) Transcript_22308:662-907(+)